MADVLQKIFDGEIPLSELYQWLREVQKSQNPCFPENKLTFVTFFINYLRENCSWLLSNNQLANDSKNNGSPFAADEIVKDDRISRNETAKTSSEIKKRCTFREVAVEKHVSNSPQSNLKCNRSIKFEKSNSNSVVHQKNIANEFHKRKALQTITIGCASYVPKRFERKIDVYEVKKPLILHERNNPAFDINNVDMFPPVSLTSNNRKQCRRITPTPVQQTTVNSFFCDTPFSNRNEKFDNAVFQTSPVQDNKDFTFAKEREMLKKAKSDIEKNVGNQQKEISKPNVSDVQLCNTESIHYIEPDPRLVHSSKKLAILIEIYGSLINFGFVPNIVSELYFVVQLITSSAKSSNVDVNGNNLFNSVHNCVYFAVFVLVKQKCFLTLLDSSTSKMLLKIPHLHKFSKELVKIIMDSIDEKCIKRQRSFPTESVSFQSDTDNRNNFPNDNTFHSFRKQRDLFYEILREWQKNHAQFDEKFQDYFTCKVKQLISICSETVNYFHLARLFKSQLIASCLGSVEVNSDSNESLKDLKCTVPDRLEKLNERFSAPSRVGGPCPQPSFYGIQCFFQEFLEVASSAPLNQHLLNIFASKILELNDYEFCLEADSNVINDINEKFYTVLHTLRLFAKFFGFIFFMPYKIGSELPKNIIHIQKDLRKNVYPLLNITNFLQRAIVKHQLVLTVPWVIEYLSMMDPVAPYLDENVSVIHILDDIYKGKCQRLLNSTNFMFLRILIGWLFENFNLFSIVMSNAQGAVKDNGLILPENTVDSFNLIDKQLIYSCCPYLSEFKVLLDDCTNGIKSKTREVRKIKPVSTSLCSSVAVKQQTQLLLEDNFFFLHPPSVKKTVEFVADRVTSKIIQKVRSEIYTLKLKTAESVLNSADFKQIKENIKQNKEKYKMLINTETLKLCDEAKLHVLELINNCCFSEISKILPLLLPDDTKSEVVKVCCNISMKISSKKIKEWADVNIIPENIQGDIKTKVEQTLKEENGLCQQSFSTECIDVSGSFLNTLRDITTKIHLKDEESYSEGVLIDLCNEMKNIVNACHQMNGAVKLIITQSVNIIISVIVQSPRLCTEELLMAFTSFWLACPRNSFSVHDFLCSRNLYFLKLSKELGLSWKKFSCMLNYLMKADLIKTEELSVYFNYLDKDAQQELEYQSLINYTQNMNLANKILA